MSQYAQPKKIVPFAPSPKDQQQDTDVDRSGHAIVALLQEAAKVASDNCERAMNTAYQLSDQLRAAEDREKELQAQVRYFQDRATRAEAWLVRVYKEIENKFFNQNTPATKNSLAGDNSGRLPRAGGI